MRCRTAVVSLLLILSGCGGSGGDNSDGLADDAVATTSTEIGQTTAVSPEVSTTSEPSTIATEPGDADMSPENCPLIVAALSGAANAAAAGVAANPTAELPVANMRALADRIPEISDDLRTVADAYEAFFQRLEELGVDLSDPTTIAGLDPGVIEEMDAAAAALDEGSVGQANANIEAFFEKECS